MNLTRFYLLAYYIISEKLYFTKCFFNQSSSSPDVIYKDSLRLLLANLLVVARVERCFVVMTDDWHDTVYDSSFFKYSLQPLAYFYIKMSESEDLMAPHYQTVRVLKQIKYFNCDFHLITMLNGMQVKRLLLFLEKYRVLNTKRKFVFMYDDRLISQDMLHIWSSMISTVFIKEMEDKSFTMSTIAFPNILKGLVVTKPLIHWTKGGGKHFRTSDVFPNRSSNLKGIQVPVAAFQHIPMVIRKNNVYSGLEVEIIKTLAKIMNFQPQFYESHDSVKERWGRKLRNGSYTGLIGQLTSNATSIVIGDLHIYTAYGAVLDFSAPHSYECLTFLTPESSQDTSWKTFIQPFSGNMWVGVLLSLFLVGTVFYILSFLHALLMGRKYHKLKSEKFFQLLRKRRSAAHITTFNLRDVKFRRYLNQMAVTKKNEDLFDNFSNCILLTYSMLMYVSLPRVPRNWPLRVLTGWYWLYCILITVSYRASFTAILANPVPSITINTLEELLQSRLTLTVGSEANKQLFDKAFDGILKELGTRTDVIASIDGVYLHNNVLLSNMFTATCMPFLLAQLQIRPISLSSVINDRYRTGEEQLNTISINTRRKGA